MADDDVKIRIVAQDDASAAMAAVARNTRVMALEMAKLTRVMGKAKTAAAGVKTGVEKVDDSTKSALKAVARLGIGIGQFSAAMQVMSSGMAGIIAGMTTMGRALNNLSKGLDSAVQLFGKFAPVVKRVGVVLAGVTVGIVAMSFALKTLVNFVVGVGREFTFQMSRVGAISGAVGDDFDKLEAKARQLGSSTAFTATQAAKGMELLSMAGFNATQIIASMDAVLGLAAVSGADMAITADILTNIMSGFNMEAKESVRIADILTKTFTTSNTTIEGLGLSMSFVSTVAEGLGIEITDVAAALGVLGDAGIKGMRAGTGLRGALLRLARPAFEAGKMIKQLRIEVFDAEGKMKDLPAVIGEFERALRGMTEQEKIAALTTMVSMESVAAFQRLIKVGERGLRSYGNVLKDSIGENARIAAKQMDNLEGDMLEFAAATEGFKLAVFNKMETPLRSLVQNGLTPAIKALSRLFEGEPATKFQLRVRQIKELMKAGTFQAEEKGGPDFVFKDVDKPLGQGNVVGDIISAVKMLYKVNQIVRTGLRLSLSDTIEEGIESAAESQARKEMGDTFLAEQLAKDKEQLEASYKKVEDVHKEYLESIARVRRDAQKAEEAELDRRIELYDLLIKTTGIAVSEVVRMFKEDPTEQLAQALTDFPADQYLNNITNANNEIVDSMESVELTADNLTQTLGISFKNIIPPPAVYTGWTRLDHHIHRLFLGPAGVFAGLRKGLDEYKSSLGSLVEVSARATMSGLQTMQSGISEAWSGLLFGGDNKEDMESALALLERLYTETGQFMPGHTSDIGIMRSLNIFEGLLDSITGLDIPPELLQQVALLRADILSADTDAEVTAFRESLSRIIDQLDSEGSILGRFEQFGKDMWTAVKDGFAVSVVEILTAETVKFMFSLGESALISLWGAGKEMSDEVALGVRQTTETGLLTRLRLARAGLNIGKGIGVGMGFWVAGSYLAEIFEDVANVEIPSPVIKGIAIAAGVASALGTDLGEVIRSMGDKGTPGGATVGFEAEMAGMKIGAFSLAKGLGVGLGSWGVGAAIAELFEGITGIEIPENVIKGFAIGSGVAAALGTSLSEVIRSMGDKTTPGGAIVGFEAEMAGKKIGGFSLAKGIIAGLGTWGIGTVISELLGELGIDVPDGIIKWAAYVSAVGVILDKDIKEMLQGSWDSAKAALSFVFGEEDKTKLTDAVGGMGDEVKGAWMTEGETAGGGFIDGVQAAMTSGVAVFTGEGFAKGIVDGMTGSFDIASDMFGEFIDSPVVKGLKDVGSKMGTEISESLGVEIDKLPIGGEGSLGERLGFVIGTGLEGYYLGKFLNFAGINVDPIKLALAGAVLGAFESSLSNEVASLFTSTEKESLTTKITDGLGTAVGSLAGMFGATQDTSVAIGSGVGSAIKTGILTAGIAEMFGANGDIGIHLKAQFVSLLGLAFGEAIIPGLGQLMAPIFAAIGTKLFGAQAERESEERQKNIGAFSETLGAAGGLRGALGQAKFFEEIQPLIGAPGSGEFFGKQFRTAFGLTSEEAAEFLSKTKFTGAEVASYLEQGMGAPYIGSLLSKELVMAARMVQNGMWEIWGDTFTDPLAVAKHFYEPEEMEMMYRNMRDASGYEGMANMVAGYLGDNTTLSAKTGLGRVPGSPGQPIPAILHGGERVLTAQETRNMDNGGITVNMTFNIQGNGDTELLKLIETRAAPIISRQVAQTMKNGSRWGQVEISNRAVRNIMQ